MAGDRTDDGSHSSDHPELAEDYPLPKSPECPFCGGTDTDLQSPFGSVLSSAQYYCHRCRTVFEWMKRSGGR